MTILAHYDGKVLIPDEPVELTAGQPLRITIAKVEEAASGTRETGTNLETATELDGSTQFTEEEKERFPLLRLLEIAEQFPSDEDTPTDRAAQHDHYLYGAPKRP